MKVHCTTRNCAVHIKHIIIETVGDQRKMNKLMSQSTSSQSAFHGKKQKYPANMEMRSGSVSMWCQLKTVSQRPQHCWKNMESMLSSQVCDFSTIHNLWTRNMERKEKREKDKKKGRKEEKKKNCLPPQNHQIPESGCSRKK